MASHWVRWSSVVVLVLVSIGCRGSESDGASAAAQAKAVRLETGLGLRFEVPAGWDVRVVTTNPEVHQLTVESAKQPGLLIIRTNPKNTAEPISLDDVAESVRQNMGPDATVSPSQMLAAGGTHAAKTVKSRQLGLVPSTDVVSVLTIGGRNYVVNTHCADEDCGNADRMYQTVLRSLAGG